MFARFRTQRVDKGEKLAAEVTLVRALFFLQMFASVGASVVIGVPSAMPVRYAVTVAKLNGFGMMMRHNTVSNNDKRA